LIWHLKQHLFTVPPSTCNAKLTVAHIDPPIVFSWSIVKKCSAKIGARKILHKNASGQNFGAVNQNSATACEM